MSTKERLDNEIAQKLRRMQSTVADVPPPGTVFRCLSRSTCTCRTFHTSHFMRVDTPAGTTTGKLDSKSSRYSGEHTTRSERKQARHHPCKISLVGFVAAKAVEGFYSTLTNVSATCMLSVGVTRTVSTRTREFTTPQHRKNPVDIDRPPGRCTVNAYVIVCIPDSITPENHAQSSSTDPTRYRTSCARSAGP
jgi:hypothetical protein